MLAIAGLHRILDPTRWSDSGRRIAAALGGLLIGLILIPFVLLLGVMLTGA